MITQFIIWFGIFMLLAILFGVATGRWRYLTLILSALIFFVAATHERMTFYTPIDGLPNPSIHFEYNHHKVHFQDDKMYVLVWITNVDNEAELLYNFPYEGNEKLKQELDRLKQDIEAHRKGNGPYQMNGNIDTNNRNNSDNNYILEVNNSDNGEQMITKEPEQ